MPRYLQYVLAALIVALMIGGPFAYSRYQQHHLRNFHVVEEGILYRSGQLSLSGLQRIKHDYGIKTVVTLRDADIPGQPPPDLAEEEFCRKEELNYYRITPQPYSAEDGSVPAEKGIAQFLEIVHDPAHYPILVHCFAGIHRTGAYCAIYRMEHHRWSNEQAMAEMVAHGYDTLESDEDLLGFLKQYVPTWGRTANGK